MSLSAPEIGKVVAVLTESLMGASVREVLSEAENGRITLLFRNRGENHFLRIVTTPGATRLHRIPSKPKSAPTPHPFVMLLRRELVGRAVTNIEWVNQDRVVRFSLERGDRRCGLVAELTNRQANLFWLDGDGVVGGAFHQTRPGRRDLTPGRPYAPPAPRELRNPQNRFESTANIEDAIDAHYRDAEAAGTKAQHYALLTKMIKTVRRRLNRLASKLETDLARAESGDTLQLLGHVLKARLKAVEKGMTQLTTQDFEGNTVDIPLDPRLSAVENMEKLFSKAKRFNRAIAQIENRVLQNMSDLEELDTVESEIEGAPTAKLAAIQTRLIKRYPFLKRVTLEKKHRPDERLPYFEFAIANGLTARVGRSAKENDTLTLRHAHPWDLWLHVRGIAGSHVVVPMEKRAAIPSPEALVDAAHLAAHFSKMKGETDVEVIYTQRRYVQKPKGAAPGSVRLIREKTLNLKVEEARLARLLRGNESPSAH